MFFEHSYRINKYSIRSDSLMKFKIVSITRGKNFIWHIFLLSVHYAYSRIVPILICIPVLPISKYISVLRMSTNNVFPDSTSDVYEWRWDFIQVVSIFQEDIFPLPIGDNTSVGRFEFFERTTISGFCVFVCFVFSM